MRLERTGSPAGVKGPARSPRRLDAAAAIDLGLLAGNLGYHLRLAHARVFQDFARSMAAFKLSPGQLGMLLLVAANPGLSQSALGVALGIDRSTVVPLVDRLEARGLVRRDARPGDRRSHALALGRQGAALLERLTPALDRHEARITARLSGAERRRLIALLARVAGR